MQTRINKTNAAIGYMWKLLRVNPKSSHYKEKNFPFLISYLYEMMLSKFIVVIISWAYKSNHYASYLKLIQFYIYQLFQ